MRKVQNIISSLLDPISTLISMRFLEKIYKVCSRSIIIQGLIALVLTFVIVILI